VKNLICECGGGRRISSSALRYVRHDSDAAATRPALQRSYLTVIPGSGMLYDAHPHEASNRLSPRAARVRRTGTRAATRRE
jgi:hypothetical protein